MLQAIFSSDAERCRFFLLPSLKELAVPTFILHGKQDIVPAWTAQEIKDAIPQSEIVVLDHCDHFPYIEQPSQLVN